MARKIADQAFLDSIATNQSYKLLTEFRKRFPEEADAIKVLDRVLLMTPENIHLNSFMYEPILDMSDDHLRRLYEDVIAIGS